MTKRHSHCREADIENIGWYCCSVNGFLDSLWGVQSRGIETMTIKMALIYVYIVSLSPWYLSTILFMILSILFMICSWTGTTSHRGHDSFGLSSFHFSLTISIFAPAFKHTHTALAGPKLSLSLLHLYPPTKLSLPLLHLYPPTQAVFAIAPSIPSNPSCLCHCSWLSGPLLYGILKEISNELLECV